jgi:hypothetical protein
MDAIEPHAISLLWFTAFTTVCAVAFLVVAGMFPFRSPPEKPTSGVATLLVVSNVCPDSKPPASIKHVHINGSAGETGQR